MQIKNNYPNYFQNRWLIGIVKLLLIASCFFFIIHKLSDESFDFQQINLPTGFGLTIMVVVVLMIVNWYLEALRWKISLKTFETITIQKAWMVVLSGLSLNWILPFTSGDLIARIFRQQDKYRTTSAVILNRGIMLGVTLIFGIFGISYLMDNYTFNKWTVGIIALGLLLIPFLFKKRFKRFFSHYLTVDRNTFTKIFLLSLLRYLTFTIQFYLLLRAFLPFLDVKILVAGIGWVFFMRSVFPLFFGGAGVREVSGILFFEPHVNEIQLVMIPIFLIWVINMVLPSLLGLFFVWKFKFNIV